MDLPVPKNEMPKVAMPTLPVLPSIFAQLIPAPVPQLGYKQGVLGLLEGFFHNWKLLQLKRSADREADIAEAKLRQTQAQFRQIEDLLLFGQRYELAMEKIKQEQDMLEINKQTAQANLITIQLKNMLAQIEVQKSQLEFQHMLKELGGDGNGSSQD